MRMLLPEAERRVRPNEIGPVDAFSRRGPVTVPVGSKPLV